MIQRVILTCILLGIPVSSSYAEEHSDEREAARLLAVLFDSGRVAVGKNQDLINDPAKGDKGFTPALFEKLRNKRPKVPT